MGGVTSFTYSDEGKLLSLTDPVGNTTKYEHDALGRMVKETNPLDKSRIFEYGFGGQLTKKTDRNGRVTEFVFDKFGRPTHEKWLNGKKTVKTFSYKFDQRNNVISVNDGFTKYEYEFDLANRETKSQMNVQGLKPAMTLTNQFDEQGLKSQTSAKIGGVVAFVNDYTYDANRKMASIVQGDKRVEYSYNTAGQRVLTTANSGETKVFETQYDYDGIGRLNRLTHQNDVGVIANYDYSWDVGNRITSINDAEYGYDKTSQLVSAEYDTLPKELYDSGPAHALALKFRGFSVSED